MKDRKRELNLYQLYDYQGVERHLEAMATKGWRLERVGTYFWQYRRAEPAQVTYAVTYVSDASLFNPRPTENQERLDELCAAAGWEKVGDWAQMQVFVSEQPDPVPLETEDAVRIEAIHRSMKKNFLPSNYFLLALPLLWLFMAFSDFRRDPVNFFSSSTDFFLILLSILLLALQGVNLSAYYRWRKRSLAAVAQGGPCAATGGYRWFNQAVLGFLAVLTATYLASLVLWQRTSAGVYVLWLLIFGLILLAVLCTREGLKHIGAPKRLNMALTLAVDVILAVGAISLLTFGILRLGWFTGEGETYLYQNQEWQTDPPVIPLTAGDLTGISYDHIRRWEYGSGSPFMSAAPGPRLPARTNPTETPGTTSATPSPAPASPGFTTWSSRIPWPTTIPISGPSLGRKRTRSPGAQTPSGADIWMAPPQTRGCCAGRARSWSWSWTERRTASRWQLWERSWHRKNNRALWTHDRSTHSLPL